ncbi:MAG: hydantoinase/oxoprolinase family protein [Actinobacteria bacterium]|nr:hydantoinase/oxoprolinase family protein [Actinomycetota bacterium]
MSAELVTLAGSHVGVDTGGTFTDLVATDAAGNLSVAKTLSTPREPALSTRAALAKTGLGRGQIGSLAHGSTIATNALIERHGAVVGLITTRGFTDILQIQRVVRPNSFDLDWVRPEPLVPRELTRGVAERVGADGAVRVPLDEDGVRAAARELAAAGVEAIAISFLFSFLEPAHERRARELVEEVLPAAPVSISSEVFGQWREYERTSTCAIDAFLRPAVTRYADALREMADDLAIGDLLVARSNGGTQTPEGAKERPVSMVRSGPACGVIAAAEVGKATASPNLLIADMGGTSFDTGIIHEHRPQLTTQAELDWGIPIAVPMVDVRSVGAGGGSIGWIDQAGLLRAGPQSAGSEPGPACYGRGGTEPTVTDANLVLGRLSPDLPLAGDVALDVEAARAALATLAEPLGQSVEEVALGLLAIADNRMAQALRLVSIDRGFDPRDFALIAFGGAGPLHSGALARALGVGRVVIPVLPGAFSAFGALLADTRFDYMQTFITAATEPADRERIFAIFAALEQRAHDDFAAEGIEGTPTIARTVEMRYAGQNWELTVPLEGEVGDAAIDRARERFHGEHDAQFGWHDADAALELVNFKLVASLPRSRPEPAPLASGALPEPTEMRATRFAGDADARSIPVYWREQLLAGNRIEGPALIAETTCTTLLHPGDSLEVDPAGHLIVAIGEEGGA